MHPGGLMRPQVLQGAPNLSPSKKDEQRSLGLQLCARAQTSLKSYHITLED